MSRLAVTIAQSDKGDWHVIALPDIPAAEQKEIGKKIRATGKYKYRNKKYNAQKAYVLTTTGVLRRYDRIKQPVKPVKPEPDEITETNETDQAKQTKQVKQTKVATELKTAQTA